MRALVCLAFLLAGPAWADETADRAAIREAIMQGPRPAHHPSEPLSGDFWPFWPDYLQRSWAVEVRSIRFITPDVALAEGGVGDQRLLFVLKKAQSSWKIAAVRFLR